jgi:hypothetical protein
VASGLFARREAGFELLNYGQKNETKEQIEVRRQETAKRVANHREKRARNAVTARVTDDVTGSNVTETARVLVPGSGSPSVSGSEDQREPPRMVYGDTPPPKDIPITEEIRANCAIAGARVPTPADVVECLAYARKQGYQRRDWGAELVSWMCKSKRFDRNREPERPPAHGKRIEPIPNPHKPKVSNG